MRIPSHPDLPAEDFKLIFLRKEGEWWEAQLSMKNTPCVPFQFHASDYEAFGNERELFAFLHRKAAEMIEQFGDARVERPFMGVTEQEYHGLMA